jgi:cytidylate kinase
MAVSMPEKHIAKAIARFEARSKKPAVSATIGPIAKIITLSRDYGTEGHAIGEVVAGKLGCSFWDREILDMLAGESGWKLQARMFEALDEKAQGAIDAVVADFFGRLERDNYFHLLPKAICTIAHEDAVIVGRGAHLILPHAFRVKLEASLAMRVQAVVELEGIAEKSARQKINQIDKDRAGFIKQLSKIISVKPEQLDYDLRINTDHISIENAAQTILDAFERFMNDKK